MPSFSIDKAPLADLSYSFDWADGGLNDGAADDPGWLQGDTILSSDTVVTGPDSALVLGAESETGALVSFKLVGGTLATDAGVVTEYEVANTITTVGGDVDTRTLLVRITNK